MTMVNQRPYTVDVAIINANGQHCRFPVRVWSTAADLAAEAAMNKAQANGHNVYGYCSVALA